MQRSVPRNRTSLYDSESCGSEFYLETSAKRHLQFQVTSRSLPRTSTQIHRTFRTTTVDLSVRTGQVLRLAPIPSSLGPHYFRCRPNLVRNMRCGEEQLQQHHLSMNPSSNDASGAAGLRTAPRSARAGAMSLYECITRPKFFLKVGHLKTKPDRFG
jgi:hypothetical protein